MKPGDVAHYEVEHVTHYDYSAPVVHAHHLLHLSPRAHEYQNVIEHDVAIEPAIASLQHGTDSFGNLLSRLELGKPHKSLVITSRSVVDVMPRPAWPARESLSWERVRDDLSYSSRARTPQELDVVRYRPESPHVRIKNAFTEFSVDCFPKGQPTLVCAEQLMQKIFRDFTYTPGATQVNTSLLAVLETRRGVCQDYSHLMIACLRSQGLAARYVSGYLRTVSPGKEALVGADASHAWVSVYAPPFGWVDLDPTNGVRVNTDHLTLAWGRDFSDVSPVRGVIVGGGHHEVKVAVAVRPVRVAQ